MRKKPTAESALMLVFAAILQGCQYGPGVSNLEAGAISSNGIPSSEELGGDGLIVFYRDQTLKMVNVNLPIKVNGRAVGALGPGSFFYQVVLIGPPFLGRMGCEVLRGGFRFNLLVPGLIGAEA